MSGHTHATFPHFPCMLEYVLQELLKNAMEYVFAFEIQLSVALFQHLTSRQHVIISYYVEYQLLLSANRFTLRIYP